jgi:hypothetical protein
MNPNFRMRYVIRIEMPAKDSKVEVNMREIVISNDTTVDTEKR